MWRCPYCKCNIQDTAAARKFHESGKRHKEAVEQYMLEMRVKNYQRQMARDEVEDELKKIEVCSPTSGAPPAPPACSFTSTCSFAAGGGRGG